jgi:hypothetical protein
VSRATARNAEAPGQDSFLDVVTNLVGILIILVMVLGVRAKDAFLGAAPTTDATPSAPTLAIEAAATAAEAVETDMHRLDAIMQRQKLEIDYRREERNRVHLLLTAAEQAIQQKRDQLDATQQAQFDLQRDLIAARTELADLDRDRNALEHAAATPAVIEHLPTPMAKTVFGKELHFRLSEGRLTYVPWDELVAALQREAPRKAWRLKDEPSFTETLGPIGGFWMRYTLKRVEHTTPTRTGIAVQQRVELDRFVLVPVVDTLGEPLEDALRSGSDFDSLIRSHKPAETTVTVWVYPDSYAQFRAIKHALFQRGYLTASRPLPEGQPIGGSPNGTRSAAQ